MNQELYAKLATVKVTDSKGHYSFKVVPPTDCNIETIEQESLDLALRVVETIRDLSVEIYLCK